MLETDCLTHRCCTFAVIPLIAIGFVFGFCAIAAVGEDIPASATLVEELTRAELEVRQDQNRLFLLFPPGKTTPEKITLPRLGNVITSIHWIGEEKSSMQVKPEQTEWIIDLSRRPESSELVIVVELDAPAELFNKQIIAHPDNESGIIRLPAKYAATFGQNLRFEPQPHKNTVGYWSNEKDSAVWTFQCDKSGEYEVDILQGCGKGHGGSQVRLQVAEQALDFVVEETGHFQNFIWRTLGTVQLKAGDNNKPQTLSLVPQSKPGGAVMDVRAIRLCPTGSKRTFEPELADPKTLPVKQ